MKMKRLMVALAIAMTLSGARIYATPYQSYVCTQEQCSMGYDLWMIWTCETGRWLGCITG